MADLTITLTIPDDKVADFYESLRFKYGRKGDGTAYSNAELRQLKKDEVRATVKKDYRTYKKSLNEELNVT
jgi:hypothetical protein